MSDKSRGFELWTRVLCGAKHIVAPMVDQSELPWRMLGRKYGAELCYTPMFHAAMFKRDKNYRRDNFTPCEEDRPLIVQFCANDPETLLEAARHVAPFCDAVDINLGCPQFIAKKGHYGAFLQDEWDLLTSMISLLDEELSVPVTCKIRVFEDLERTVEYAKMLERAGCQLLTVHGRTREQRGGQTGLASWDHIKAIRQNISIPMFANGNIQFQKDVERCLLETGVQGIMSAEGHLFNPALFTGEHPPCWRVSEEYLAFVQKYPCATSAIRGHLFKLWLHVLKEPEFQCFRGRIGVAKTWEDFSKVSSELKALLLANLSEEDLEREFTNDKIPFWRCQPYFRPNRGVAAPASERAAEAMKQASEERTRRKKRTAENKAAQCPPKKKRWFTCESCKGNPKGLKCAHSMCKTCCKSKCAAELVGCAGHKFTPKNSPSSKAEDILRTTLTVSDNNEKVEKEEQLSCTDA